MHQETGAQDPSSVACTLSRHDLHGAFLFASNDAPAIFGRTAGELVGESLRAAFVVADAPQIDQALTRAASTDEPVTLVCTPTDQPTRRLELCLHGVRAPGGGEVFEVHCLTRDVSAVEARVEAAREHARRMERLVDNVPGSVWGTWSSNIGTHRAQFVSQYAERLTGYPIAEWTNNTALWAEVVHPDDRAKVAASGQRLMANGQDVTEARWIRRDGRVIWVESHVRATKDASGALIGLSGVTMDITARKEAEEAQARLREEILAELSTPLIPISEHVVVMPLIGTIDRNRAENIVQALLGGVTTARAQVAIIDITGVPNVDVEVAQSLVRAARGVRLLGAQVVLTGIRPEVAQTLIALGTDLQGITTLGTLQSGIRFAMQRT